jgi:hypothetical protein
LPDVRTVTDGSGQQIGRKSGWLFRAVISGERDGKYEIDRFTSKSKLDNSIAQQAASQNSLLRGSR